MSQSSINNSIFERELLNNHFHTSLDECRPTCYKSFVDSILDQDNYDNNIDCRNDQEWTSNLIDYEEPEEYNMEFPMKYSEKLESPKGFQNPLMTSKSISSSDHKSFTNQEISNNNQNISAFSSLRTVISIYVPSSYHSSELGNTLSIGTSEKMISLECSEKKLSGGFDNSNSIFSSRSTFQRSENSKEEKEITKLYLLGEGSEAKVYLCELEGLENLVAYKQFKPNKTSFSKVEKEFKLIEHLDHPNIINYCYLKSKTHQRDSYGIVMEFMEGETLSDFVKTNFQNMNYEFKMNLASQIIAGVEYLHSQNIVHGDLKKPENIMLSNDKTKIKIGDFGMAEKFNQGYEYLKKQAGSLEYMAPEVLIHQQFSKKADIWSLGCVLHYLFFGYHPYSRKTRISDLLDQFEKNSHIKVRNDDNFWNSRIGRFIEGCLVFEPQNRFYFSEMSINSIS